MYGNNFDYGNPKLDTVRNQVDDIMASTRDAVSNLGTGSTYDSIQAGMGDALSNAGVGDVGSFLAEAYTPNVPTSTPSYSSFMADTPGRIQSAITAKQTAYNAGQEDRMKDFQDLLKEVKTYSYGGSEYTPATDPGPGAASTAGAAEAEFKALMPKFKDGSDKKTENSLATYQDLFGNKFSMSDYNSLIDQGVKPSKIENNIMAYNAAGGKVGASVFNQFGYDVVKPKELAGSMGPYITNHKGNYVVPQSTGSSLFPGAEGFSFY